MSRMPAATELVEFFSLVRELERQAGAGSLEAGHERVLLGQDGPSTREAVKLRSTVGMAFASNAAEMANKSVGQRQELMVSFMGLAGPSGVLPQHYTRLLMERGRHRDSTLADFLDLFNHRLFSLFYRGWLKYRLPRQYDLHNGLHSPDPYSRTLRNLSGQISDQGSQTSLYYSGQFSRSIRSATALQDMLADFLELPVAVKSFVGQWLPVSPKDRLKIGSRGRGRNNQLGAGVLPGRRCWDVQSRIAIEIGEMDTLAYARIRRGTETFDELERLIRLYVPSQISVEVRLRFRDSSDSLPTLSGGAQLGRTSWLKPRGGTGLMVEKVKLN
ncbi:type VI secretion system baseplate subunit TssG [Oceanobacter mangrovi]|uniref:type VI secretion system baseplate subunit TssG n=1 Tax=Oceanobacter mangrovi TaxID=2862510 RepID=UPI001C8D73A5|nr:type VI secretion system baseplate subunit TssG [Oceanobacter mangrovi]